MDIKLIVAYKASSDVILTMEIQLILEPILRTKMILHKFYDITRLEFHPIRLEFFKLLEYEM
jgi:hypothetical protein